VAESSSRAGETGSLEKEQHHAKSGEIADIIISRLDTLCVAAMNCKRKMALGLSYQYNGTTNKINNKQRSVSFFLTVS
jgi:hypothetical protein